MEPIKSYISPNSLNPLVKNDGRPVRVKKTFHYFSVRSQKRKSKKVCVFDVLSFIFYSCRVEYIYNNAINLEPVYDDDMDEEEEVKPKKKKSKPAITKPNKVKQEANDGPSPNKRKKKQEDEQEVWKW